MSVLDRMIQYASTRKSPLEMLKDKHRQDAADQMAEEQHKSAMAMNQLKMEEIKSGLEAEQKASEVLKSLPADATNMQKAETLASAGYTDYATMFADLANKESLAADREAGQKAEQARIEIAGDTLGQRQEEAAALQEHRQQTYEQEQEALSMRKSELELSEKRERRVAEQEGVKLEQATQKRKEERAKFLSTKASDTFSTTNKALVMSGVELVNKGTDKKPNMVPNLSPYNMNLVRTTLKQGMTGDVVDQIATNENLEDKFAIIPRDSVDVKGWDDLPNNRDLLVPRDFIEIIKRNDVPEGRMVELFIMVENDLSTGTGDISKETAKALIQAGVTKEEFARIFLQ